MIKPAKNFAYIDGANLHRGVASSGWKLDYCKFRVWLTEKYGVQKAYIFIGLIPKIRMAQKEKAPDKDGTLQGSFS